MSYEGLPRITVEELAQLELFAEDTPEALAWIAERMFVRRLEPGEVFIEQGAPVKEFLVVLEGEGHFAREADPLGTLYIRRAGQAAGVLPFSRVKTARGRGWAVTAARIAVMDASYLRELVYRAPCLGQKLVSEMTDRTREFAQLDERGNKLLALGKLSAGLAHELNNPASAVVRSASHLRETVLERRREEAKLQAAGISAQARAHLTGLIQEAQPATENSQAFDILAQADLESGLAESLSASGADEALAPDLVEVGMDGTQLGALAAAVPPGALTSALRVVVAERRLLSLASEVEEASQRIFDLVSAIKSYSYMDQVALKEVDIEAGIDLTLRIFQHRIRNKVQFDKQFAGNLPRIYANATEIHQVWTNLIDNALDALEPMPGPKILTVKTRCEPTAILVEIGDNGPGVPPELQSRIFEPFFTTKPMGEGTGLGLDIVQQILRKHHGSLRLESVPGRTVFQARFPLPSTAR